MRLLLLISAIFLLAGIFMLVVRILYGFQGSDFLFLAANILPLFWLARFDSIYILYGDSPLILPFGILGLVIFFLIWFANSETRLLMRTATKRILVLFLVLICLFSFSILFNSQDSIDYARGIQALCYVILPFIAALLVVRCCSVDIMHLERALLTFLIGGMFISFLAVSSAVFPGLYRGIVTTYVTELERGRSFTTVGGPSGTAMYLMLIYCLASGQIIAKHRRLLSVCVLVLSFLGILVTQTRAILPVFILVNIYLYFWHFRSLGRRMLLFLLLLGFLLLPTTYFLNKRFPLTRFLVWGRYSGVGGGSFAARTDSFKTAMRYGLNHPALGGGLGLVYNKPRRILVLGPAEAAKPIYLEGHPSNAKPHSLFALTFAEGGLGALIVLLLLFYVVWKATKPPDSYLDPYGNGITRGYRAGFLSIFLICIVQDHLFMTHKLPFLFYLFAFMGIATSSFFNHQADYYVGSEDETYAEESAIEVFAETELT
ncbi:MAG: hypothetical protein GWN67_21715 [Phycisphaerae bacterium]|nr:hypothetical protein [Phycisphaerae bacterium]NIP54688.1 hypothetical protein [Phycisphaerae bacterium]NIS53557.1 hypothetical protein [Phycisphaerae bacterium]NIU11017.1 hypothetical protein [Phycisphaerae bacterium]NIU58900.1 hypothetical protein [Phycisphaerae bacterium]